MLILDNITILICVILVVLTALSSLSDTFFRKIAVGDNHHDICHDGRKPEPVSVVIISDNNSRELEANLSYFLNQDYAAGYEVIVVVSKDENGTKDMLETFRKHSNLYVTFVPDTSRYMSLSKLAVTLGVKAAKNEWVLLTDATCCPKSENWISCMYSKCCDDIGLVLGYSNYSDEATPYQRFDRLHREYAFMNEASRNIAYSVAGNNLMFRKSMFMGGRGFQGNLKFLRGEYDFLVNKYAKEGNTAVNTCSDAFLMDTAPSKKGWHNSKMFYQETRRNLLRSFRHRIVFNADMLSLHICLMAAVGSAIYSIWFSEWIILPFAFIALICPLVARVLLAKRAIRLFDANVPLWKVIPFELYMVLHNFKYILRYKFSDKYEFISHKS